jgi:hypothetical protein
MRTLIFLILFFSLTVNASITEISIIPNSAESFQMPIKFTSPFKSSSRSYMELGDTISNSKIHISASNLEQFRISVQLETSMSIQDEGPHLDLVNWKHCTTNWFMVENIAKHKFKLPNFDNINLDCFPKVTISEIKNAALEQGGEHWVAVIENNISNDYSPISIDLSLVRIKVEQFVKSKWVLVTVLNIDVPLGC